MAMLILAGCKSSAWKLEWKENFNGPSLDLSQWEKIPRGIHDWNNYMSDYDSCYDFRKGKLVLRGIHNRHVPTDTARYLTGGVRTQRGFMPGKIEIRAKLGEAKGAWPAFWMLPVARRDAGKPGVEPIDKLDKSEIDIMEHLNYDSIAYQTVHSHYTVDLGKKKAPPHYATGRIRNNKYNVYAVEVYADSLVFAINGKKTFTYPRWSEEEENLQFEFAKRPFYLMLDMQLGGQWVGAIDPNDVPVEMEIDWVKYYRRK